MTERAIVAVVTKDQDGRLVARDDVAVDPDDEVVLVQSPAGLVAVVGHVDMADADALTQVLDELGRHPPAPPDRATSRGRRV